MTTTTNATILPVDIERELAEYGKGREAWEYNFYALYVEVEGEYQDEDGFECHYTIGEWAIAPTRREAEDEVYAEVESYGGHVFYGCGCPFDTYAEAQAFIDAERAHV